MKSTTVSRRRRTWWQFAGYLARRAIVMELRGYQSIHRVLFRRPRVPPGAAGFSYHQPVLPILIVISVVSAIEMVVVDIIVSRWTSVRVTLLALSIWGLVYMLGLLFGMLVRPHAVGPDGIRVRFGRVSQTGAAVHVSRAEVQVGRVRPEGVPPPDCADLTDRTGR